LAVLPGDAERRTSMHQVQILLVAFGLLAGLLLSVLDATRTPTAEAVKEFCYYDQNLRTWVCRDKPLARISLAPALAR
jgi:hypothetical protein